MKILISMSIVVYIVALVWAFRSLSHVTRTPPSPTGECDIDNRDTDIAMLEQPDENPKNS